MPNPAIFPAPGEYPVVRRESLYPQALELEHNESAYIDLSRPIDTPEAMERKFGFKGSLLATINAGGHDFFVLDARNPQKKDDFLYVVDGSFSLKEHQGYKGAPKNTPITIGRSHHKNRFNLPDDVSRSHFKMVYSGEDLLLQNLTPTNRTFLRANRRASPVRRRIAANPGLPRFAIYAERTVNALARVDKSPQYGQKDSSAPYGYFMNHPVIGRRSKTVSNGIYLGAGNREAIVVDNKSSILRNFYQDVLRATKRSELDRTIPKLELLNRMVRESMPYSDRVVEHIREGLGSNRNHNTDGLVGLSLYLHEGGGVCRHQALLAAYTIGKLIDSKQLSGSVGVERNTIPDLGGSHAWAVFKPKDTRKPDIIIDPAQDFVGTRQQARDEKRWEYELTIEDDK